MVEEILEMIPEGIMLIGDLFSKGKKKKKKNEIKEEEENGSK